MLFGRNRISYDDFGDCHDEIAVAKVDFIGRRPIVVFICKGRGASGRFQRGQLLRVIDLFIDGREEGIKV